MTRKTKAELAAEAAAYQAKLQAENEADYPVMLMNALERSTNVNFVLTVKEFKFLLQSPTGDEVWTLNPTYTKDDYEVLVHMMWEIEHEEAVIAERKRKYKAKQEALAKLTKEERVLLSLE